MERASQAAFGHDIGEEMAPAEERLIDRIYEAAVGGNGWPDMLEGLAVSMGGTAGILMARTESGSGWLASPVGAQVYQKLIVDGWAETDDRIPRLIAARRDGFLTDGEVVGADHIARLPLYAELLKPCGFHAAAATAMRIGNIDLVMTVEGFASQALARDAVPALDRLRPHLARAGLLSARLGLERARDAVTTLEQVGAPAALVGHDRKLLAANRLFDVSFDHFYADTAGGLRLADRAADRALGMMLSSLAGQKAGPAVAAGGSLALRGPDGQPRLVLHVIPVRGMMRDLFTGASAILMLSWPGRAGVPDPALIQGLLDLTPAESRLACALAAGLTLDEASRAAGMMPSTGRTHLKRIFAKTGHARQSDLIRLILSVAPPPRT